MRLFSNYRLFALIIIAVLALSACAGNGANNNNQTTPLPQEGTTPLPEPDDLAQPVATPTVDDADVVDDSVVDEPETGTIPETGANEEAQAVIDNDTMAFVSNVIGTPVINQQGEKFGEITDLAYDEHSGIVVYVILSPEGGADTALHNQVAFPWTMLGSGEAIASATEEAPIEGVGSVPSQFLFIGEDQLLNNAPSLASDALVDEEFNLWSEELYYYWREADPGFHIVGVSDTAILRKVSGLDHIQVIRGETGETHQARDIVVDLHTGNMLYIVVEAENLLPGDQGLLLIPYDYVTYGSMEDGSVGFVFTMDEEAVQNYPRLQEGDIPSR